MLSACIFRRGRPGVFASGTALAFPAKLDGYLMISIRRRRVK
jgi:hypothetical protein